MPGGAKISMLAWGAATSISISLSSSSPSRSFLRNFCRVPPDPDPSSAVSPAPTLAWGNTAFAMASRLTDAFAKYRWCANIIGPQGGGAVEELPVHVFKSGGADTMKIPTEVQIGDALDLSLSDLGFMSLSWRKGSDNAAFFAANSAQKVPESL